ncbi:hypothetical protein [Ensifer sp. SL37]|uniref:hypothetical protein n=1 Tax=Ensifer sp. SL37 TaxID=2995137 RepID=UPI002274B96A|nr:hypothetical protein [Ensifer sp. SL37]MCY1741167.1 hypothetical protein [Ensifer sp. SL37]
MLNIAIKEATESGGTKLRAVADALIEKAISGDVAAIKEVADRLDGKVPQGVIGGDEDDNPIVQEIIIRGVAANSRGA